MATNSDEVLMAFASRKSLSGCDGLEDCCGDAGPQLIYDMLSELAQQVVSELRYHLIDYQPPMLPGGDA